MLTFGCNDCKGGIKETYTVEEINLLLENLKKINNNVVVVTDNSLLPKVGKPGQIGLNSNTHEMLF